MEYLTKKDLNPGVRRPRENLLRNLTRALLSLAFVMSLARPTIAQSFRGTIHGAVKDSSGAVLVNVKVTAENTATSITRAAYTASDGSFLIPELRAGEYQVYAEAPGLTGPKVKAVVEVGVNTTVELLMQPAVSEVKINVAGEQIPLIDTTQDVLGGTLGEHLVAELPLNGRDFGKLVALVPGVIVEGSGVAGTEKGFGQFNINGNRDRSNNYTLDGTDNNDPWFNNSALNQVGITGAPATLLPIDAIQEFNLQSQFPAEYGRNTGGVVNVITKSGTNEIHGSAFGYFRNSFFDARNYFNPTVDLSGKPQRQTLFINNQFGGSIGGPIIHNKMFFFGAYEGQRERVGSNFRLSVPNAADIAEAEKVAKSQIPNINFAPLESILSYFPLSPPGFNTVAGIVNDFNNLNNFIVKLDYQINTANSFAVRYAFGQNNQEFPFGSLGGFGTGSRLAPFAQISPTRVQVVSASLLSTLDSSRINELRFGYTRFRNSFTSQDALTPKPIGLNFNTGHTGLPEFDFSGVLENLGATVFSIPRARVSQNFQILDNFTWIHAAHTIKFGGELRRAWVNAFNDNFERGLVSFSPCGCLTDPTTGTPLTPQADVLTQFFTGNGFAQASTGNTQRTTYNTGLSFFIQDSWRVRQNLTVSYGLRWEYFGPISESNGLLSNFPGPFSPTAKLQMVSELNGSYNRDLDNFGPRVSVVWNPRANTVMRAGYGIYYDYIPQDLLIANFTNSAGLATNPIGPQPVIPIKFDANAFNGSENTPSNPTPPVFFVPTPPLTPSIFVTPRNLETPYVGEWNLNIQQQVTKGAAIEVGYVGTKGTRLTRLYDANQDLLNTNYAQVATFATISDSTYNALQVLARFTNFHHLNGFSGYIFSKSLDGASDGIDFNGSTAAFPQNSDNLKAEKGPSTFDARHRWTTAMNYQVPVHGSLPAKLAQGWQLNTVVTVMSGQPIGIITTNGGINLHQRPDVVPGVNPILGRNPAFGYINPLAFAQPTPTGGFGNLGRDAIYGPGFWNIDFSVTKDTNLTERLTLQLRAEFFNIFNHPQFALPGGVVTPGAGTGLTLPQALAQCQGCFSTATPDVAQGNPGLGGGGPRVLQFAARFQF